MRVEIYEYLYVNAQGYDNKIKAKDLMRIFNIMDHKSFRKEIEELRLNGYLIGSKSGKNGGYFIPKTREEAMTVVLDLKRRANMMLRMVYVMNNFIDKEFGGNNERL